MEEFEEMRQFSSQLEGVDGAIGDKNFTSNFDEVKDMPDFNGINHRKGCQDDHGELSGGKAGEHEEMAAIPGWRVKLKENMIQEKEDNELKSQI